MLPNDELRYIHTCKGRRNKLVFRFIVYVVTFPHTEIYNMATSDCVMISIKWDIIQGK
jgi:hypothetical protein